MKTSRRISVIAALVNVGAVLLGILLINPFRDVKIGGMPVMVYGLLAWAVVSIIIGYVLIPKIEKLEEGGD